MNAVIVTREGKLCATKLDCAEPDFYKKCGFKSDAGFALQTVWEGVHLYARKSGKANSENKYEVPAPVDSALFFGKCLLVHKLENGALTELTLDEWNKFADVLIGGTESIAIGRRPSRRSEATGPPNLPRGARVRFRSQRVRTITGAKSTLPRGCQAYSS